MLKLMTMMMISGRLLGLWSPGAKRGLMRWRGTGRPGALDDDDHGDDGDDDDDDDDDGDGDYMLNEDAQEWLSSGLSPLHI